MSIISTHNYYSGTNKLKNLRSFKPPPPPPQKIKSFFFKKKVNIPLLAKDILIGGGGGRGSIKSMPHQRHISAK
jgi:hypothetical protein